jgi:hypothetical protein
MRRFLLSGFFLAAAVSILPGAASAQQANQAGGEPEPEALKDARQHFETALDHYAEGRYRQAIVEL